MLGKGAGFLHTATKEFTGVPGTADWQLGK